MSEEARQQALEFVRQHDAELAVYNEKIESDR